MAPQGMPSILPKTPSASAEGLDSAEGGEHIVPSHMPMPHAVTDLISDAFADTPGVLTYSNSFPPTFEGLPPLTPGASVGPGGG